MSGTFAALAAAAPLAAGWSLHGLRLHRRIEAARRDPLTGLLAREAFTERAARIVEANRRSAVFFIDLDHFKQVNDTYGHAVGDAVLQAVGQRLAAWNDVNGGTVARLGGDEFAAVTDVLSHAELVWMLDELTRSLDKPICFEGRSLEVGASIGAVMFDSRSNAADLSSLLRLADEEMYRAKRAGAPWMTALDLLPDCATVNGRRAGRRGTTGGTGAVA
ncbi:GGDEF domain-containing protein [Streptomyces fildesensis]|uniref:GGDEF domain-containing protein n=1 Tax=Streptomyces fildesensis TaxID=375757 RepID=A0ABW8C5I2_9ACTN